MKKNSRWMVLAVMAMVVLAGVGMVFAATHDDAVGGFGANPAYKAQPFYVSKTLTFTTADPGVASDIHQLVNIPAKTLVEAVYYKSQLQYNSTTGVVANNDWAFTLGDNASATTYATVTSASNATSVAGVWCTKNVGLQTDTGTAVAVTIAKWYAATNNVSVTITTPPTNTVLTVIVAGKYFGP